MNYLSFKCWVYVCGGSFGSVVSKRAKQASLLCVALHFVVLFLLLSARNFPEFNLSLLPHVGRTRLIYPDH